MEIILVNPGGTPAGGDTFMASKKDRHMYPYSLIYVYNYLVKNDVKAKFFDLYIRPTHEFINSFKNLTSPIIGVTAVTYSNFNAINLIRRIKKENPTAIIVVGGKHFTYTDEDTLKRVNEIDIVVRGEGEVTFYELVKALREKKDLHTIDGISYRKDGKIIRNKERNQIRDIEEVTLDYDKLPDLDFFAKGIYLRNFEKEKIKSLPIFMGRGCAQKCIFCLYNQFKYRVRKIDKIFDEINYLKKKFHYAHFTLSDPSFCERVTFAKEFCNRLIEDKINIKWSCEARVDTPVELLELMAKAGCVNLDFALESGSAKILKIIKKRIKVEQTINFAKTCKKLMIKTHIFLMVSFPEETEEDALKTLKMGRELSRYCTSMSAAVAQIFPGTELERIAYKKGILPPDFSYYDSKFFHSYTDFCDMNVPLYIENLSVEFLRKFMKEMREIKNVEYDTLYDLIIKGMYGIKKMPQQSFSTNLQNVLNFYQAIRGKAKKLISN